MIFPAREPSEPNLCIGSFELWVHGRQFPEADDYWDGNWLEITARCTGSSAVVQVSGSILHLSELHKLMVECTQAYASLSGEAHLGCMEPNLDLKIAMGSAGHCELLVSITPDHLHQKHSFIFDIDQSYLPPFIQSLELILQFYPVKGSHPKPMHP